MKSKPEQQLFDIQVSHDGKRVWVTGSDGSSVGRFNKDFGIDVHRTVTEQMQGKGQCLHCTHAPAVPEDWQVFRAKMLEHHGIDVPDHLVSWS